MAVSFTVADAVTGVDPQSILVDVVSPSPGESLTLQLTACSSPETCSGQLGATGYRVRAEPSFLDEGVNRVRVRSRNFDSPPRQLDAEYEFTALPGGSTPTAGTATATPTDTPVATATATPTQEATPSATPSGTP